ncbi:hypothetical protein D9M68_980820 [compost metagenome]
MVSPIIAAKPSLEASNLMPNSVALAMPETPNVPLVTSVQLMRTRRMISPKASVTIAR